MFFGVDHLVLCGTEADYEALAERLVPAGFVRVPNRLRFDEIGCHSRSLAYAGGGFVEVVYQVGDGAPEAWFGHARPRIMGLGVSSDALADDTAGWLWQMDEEQELEDGSAHRIRAAGPHEHLSPFYVFAMDRPDRVLDHPHLGGTAVLERLAFTGGDHDVWRRQIQGWLGRSDAIGEVELVFEPGPEPSIALSATFRSPGPTGTTPLAVGGIELVYSASG